MAMWECKGGAHSCPGGIGKDLRMPRDGCVKAAGYAGGGPLTKRAQADGNGRLFRSLQFEPLFDHIRGLDRIFA